jgi:hypothetical protein
MSKMTSAYDGRKQFFLSAIRLMQAEGVQV